MIRTESEYQQALRRLEEDRRLAEQQRAALEAAGLPLDQAEYAMQPLLSFQQRLVDDIAWYERARRRDFPTVSRLPEIGQLLIALRISRGLTQRQLAERLGVSESLVSRDEKNEYHGITLERAQRIVDALGGTVSVRIGDSLAFPDGTVTEAPGVLAEIP